MRRYFYNVLISLDQLLNALTGGDPDETVSSRAAKGKMRGEWFPCLLCRFLDLFDRQHCVENIEADEGRPVPVRVDSQ